MHVAAPLVVKSVDDWATAIAELPAVGPLPRRLVIVPNERVAHTLRVTLIEQKRQSALCGTRFLTLLDLARHILTTAGEHPVVNDAELTPRLVHDALTRLALERFDPAQLRAAPGWDRAFARSIRELEAAGIEPAQLLHSDDAQVRDVGCLFAFISQHAERVSSPALLYQATAQVSASPRICAEPGLVVLTGFETQAELSLIRALPGLVLGVSPLRPVRADHVAELRKLHGDVVTAAFSEHAYAPQGESALALLQAHLFSARASAAPVLDESVEVVTYAGVHEEVEAAAAWVVEQVLEHGIGARDIALVSPDAEAYASRLHSRLRQLPWQNAPNTAPECVVERGLLLVERSDGARMLALVRALREGLPRELLAQLLPLLKASDPEIRVPNLSRAWAVLNEVGWIGGDRAHLADGIRWQVAWQRAIARLATPPTADEPADQATARAELRGVLCAYAGAIEGLCELLRAVVDSQALEPLWLALREFLASSFRLPPSVPPATSVMHDAVRDACECGLGELRGPLALGHLEGLLHEQSARAARFGEPGVYIGSLGGLLGLRFRAVRVLGLVEGALPSASREDPVLPDAARAALSPHLPTSRTRSHRQLAAFDHALCAATEKLVLSAPRVGHEGSVRQPAAVLLDVLRALGTPADQLERALTQRAAATRRRERRLREVLAITPSAQLARTAAGERSSWAVPNVISLAALRAITRRAAPSVHDGLLQGVISRDRLPGLTPARPISASRLDTLLSCPHRYLLEQVLGLGEADGPLPSHSVDALSFGSLLHETAELFWREHGQDFGARKHSLAHYQHLMRELACASFAAFRAGYPLVSASAAESQQQELCDQLSKLLDYDWQAGKARTFVAVERRFGYAEPCTLATQAGPLHVRGSIDRLDLDGDTLLIRDLKSGKSKPRRADATPEPGIDLQLGVYARVAEASAEAWQTPSEVGVAYVYLRSGELERRWSGADYPALRASTDDWLSTALELLERGAFVRTPNPRDDCTFCPHKPTCHSEHERTPEVLEHASVPERFKRLKGVLP